MCFNYLAKLLSCMDEFRSILGDHCDEVEATDAILRHNFDLEKAIDDVLSKGKPCILNLTINVHLLRRSSV